MPGTRPKVKDIRFFWALPEEIEQTADSLIGLEVVPEAKRFVYRVAISASFAGDLKRFSVSKIGNDPLHRAFGDANFESKLADGEITFPR